MEKTLLERLKEVKKMGEISHVCFFNTGVVRKDENYSASRIKKMDSQDNYKAIEEVFYKACESYSRQYDFDSMEMDLELGLIFESSDVDSTNTIREGAKPIPNTVRYYTGSVKSHLNGEQTNTIDYDRLGYGRQGYISFPKLIGYVRMNGLEWIGPESFEELEKRILSGESFDIKLAANLVEKEDTIEEDPKQFVK